MKKLWIKFWYFGVKNRIRKVLTLGGFRVVFKEYDMEIKSLADNFALRLRAGTHPFGYLSASVGQGKDDNVHGYAQIMYIVACGLTKDKKFARDIERAVMKMQERYAATVKKEDKEEDDAALAQVAVETEMAKMPRAERRRIMREEAKRYGKDA